jgi:hypothetical protein
MPELALPATSLVAVERLEWGKLCQSPDGPIVRSSEHRTLGRSPGFPPELAALCDPERIGPTVGEEDVEPAAYPHGTVLRPVVSQGCIRPILVRVRRRPEDGDGGSARLYYLARYLAAPTPGQDPMAMFSAMESRPLSGLTEGQAAALDPLFSVAEAPALDGALPFLEKAVVYALSGVPIAISEPQPERTFFAWVTALWWLLPAPLRPLLSCGWGVARQLAGELLVAHCAEPVPEAATYSPGERVWRDPAWTALGRGDDEKRTPFDPRRLAAGRLYVHEAFGSASGLPRPAWLGGASPMVPMLAAADLPPLPDLRDAATIRVLRRPGLGLFDAYRLGEIENWLGTGEAAVSDPLAAFTGGLAFGGSRCRAALAAVPALAASDGRRERAETLLWRLLSAPGAASVREAAAGARGPGAARARLLAALAAAGEGPVNDDDLLGVLERLREAAAQEEATALPEEARGRLLAALDSSTGSRDPRLAEAHARALRLSSLPDDYQRWLPARCHELLFLLGRARPPELGGALLRLSAIAGLPSVDALGRWFLGQLPVDRDGETLAAAPAAIRERLSRFLTELWERPGSRPAEVRERILAWCRIHPPSESRDPLLHLARGAEPTAAEVAEIAAEVERGAVPPSLMAAVAVLVLGHWAVLGDRLRRLGAAWTPVIEQLPRTLAYLVFESPSGRPLAEAAEPLRAAYGRFAPSAVETRDLLTRWLPRMPLQQIDSREAAGALWDWTVAARPRPGLDLDAVEVCRHLAQGEWAPGETLSPDELEKVCRLVAEAGRLPEIAPHREVLWRGADRPWQLQLALTIFPADALEPSARQLELLRSDADWLRRHLESGGLEPHRGDVLRPALLGFHELRYPGSHGIEWRDDLGATVLWAVFAAVPFDRQGQLAAALEAFAPAGAARGRLAMRYLDAHAGEPTEAARRVAAGLAAPLLAHLRPQERQDLISRLAELRGRAPARGRLRRLAQWVATRLPWNRPIQVIDAPAGAPPASRAGRRRLALAAWLRDLLVRLLAALGEERLRSELAAT